VSGEVRAVGPREQRVREAVALVAELQELLRGRTALTSSELIVVRDRLASLSFHLQSSTTPALELDGSAETALTVVVDGQKLYQALKAQFSDE
jgi:hypothetical protein